jgi:23S rRNA pseudouridine955/2504/2580 synthase
MDETKWRVFTPREDDLDRRLDRVVRKLLSSLSLGRIYAALRKGQIRVNGKRAKPSTRLSRADRLEIHRTLVPAAEEHAESHRPSRGDSPPQNGGAGSARRHAPGRAARTAAGQKLRELICFENDAVVACNKPAGMLTHGGGSLTEAVIRYLAGRSPKSLSFTPGPMHRLDRQSSGIVLFPKTLRAAQHFSALQAAGGAEKEYVTVLAGRLSGETPWEDRLTRDETRRTTRAAAADEEGQTAVTRVLPVATAQEGGTWYTLARCSLTGGRTHQIRAQAAINGLPLEGDVKYGGPKRAGGFLLHAHRMVLHEEAAELGFTTVVAPPSEAALELLAYRFGSSTAEALFGPPESR